MGLLTFTYSHWPLLKEYMTTEDDMKRVMAPHIAYAKAKARTAALKLMIRRLIDPNTTPFLLREDAKELLSEDK